MSLQDTLFPGAQPEAERAQYLDQHVLDVLCNRQRFDITDDQRVVLTQLRYRRGFGAALKIGEICERTRLTPRAVKFAVASLVIDFQVPIGASRDSVDGGYYMVMTAEEAAEASRPYIQEIMRLALRVRVLLGEAAMLRLFGQLMLLDEKEATACDPAE